MEFLAGTTYAAHPVAARNPICPVMSGPRPQCYLLCKAFSSSRSRMETQRGSPDGVVHPGHCEEGSKIGGVGGAHDEGEEPPAAHHDAQGHGVHRAVAT